MPEVQSRRASRRSRGPSTRIGAPGRVPPALAGVLATGLAAALVFVTLTLPDRLDQVRPSTVLRMPVEGVAFLALVLLVPQRLGRLRAALAVLAGSVLALAAVFKVLDLGFLAALNRPFDPLIDWQYVGSLVETVRGAAPGALGVVLLLLAGVLTVGLLVLVPLAVLRLTHVVARHRGAALRGVTAAGSLWLATSVLAAGALGASTPGGSNLARSVPSQDAAEYVYGQVSRLPSQLRDRRSFVRAATSDPLRAVPRRELLTGLRGKDVVVVFVESFGRIAVDGSVVAPGVRNVLEAGTHRLEVDGFHSRSAYLTSPTFGALSWLAHATLQAGLWVDSQQRYDHLVTSNRLTLSALFGQAGWRTVAVVPANNRDWPQGAFYAFDHVYDSRNVGYRGPRFGYPTMPDQYTLDAFHRLELAPEERGPVMAEVDLITSHAPWSRTPHLLPQEEVGDGSVYDGMPDELPSETDIWPSPERVRAAYGDAIEYSLKAVLAFLTAYGDDDLVVVMVGDHQPATIVSGRDAGDDVPVSVIARDPAVLDRISEWGWTDGLLPAADAPVWRMDSFRDRFLGAYSSPGVAASLGVDPR